MCKYKYVYDLRDRKRIIHPPQGKTFTYVFQGVNPFTQTEYDLPKIFHNLMEYESVQMEVDE